VFAVSWISTWFSHNIEDLSQVQLIYDACIATHPLFIVYISVAQILLKKREIMSHETPDLAGFMIFNERNFQPQESILLAQELWRRHPPMSVHA